MKSYTLDEEAKGNEAYLRAEVQGNRLLKLRQPETHGEVDESY